jgi:hypothetical protein
LKHTISKHKGFLAIAAIGIAAVLIVVVFGTAAVVGQTSGSLRVGEFRANVFSAVDTLLPSVIKEFKTNGTTSHSPEFEARPGRYFFEVAAAQPDSEVYSRFGIKHVEGDLIVKCRIAPAQVEGAAKGAFNILLLVSEKADSAKPYVILEAIQANQPQ